MNQFKIFASSIVLVFPFLSVQSLSDEPATCKYARDSIQTGTLPNDATIEKVADHLKETAKNYESKVTDSDVKDKVSRVKAACEILNDVASEFQVSVSTSQEEIAQKKHEASMKLAKASGACLQVITYALDKEVELVKSEKTCSAMSDVIGKELSGMEQVLAINERTIALLKKEVDPEKPIKNFTPEQLAAIEAKGDFSSIATEKPYYSVMELGVSFMPEYDESGNNKGFNEANFFGVLKLNNRMKDFKRFENWVVYQGLEVAFYSAPIACKEKPDEEEPDDSGGTGQGADDTEQGDCENVTSVTNLKFKDISNTVNASLYVSALYKNTEWMGDWEFGFSGRRGILNREKKGTDGDSVAEYFNYGLEARLNDFGAGTNGSQYLNGLPKFIINISTGKNEDFAGTGLKTERQLASFNYRLFDNQPVFIGLIVDGGKGPDTIALNLSYGLKASSIFGLFAD